MKETLDINKKIEIAKKIENINKEVLKWQTESKHLMKESKNQ